MRHPSLLIYKSAALQVWSAGKLSGDDSQQPYHEIDVLAGHENDVNYVQFRLVNDCVQLKHMLNYVHILSLLYMYAAAQPWLQDLLIWTTVWRKTFLNLKILGLYLH